MSVRNGSLLRWKDGYPQGHQRCITRGHPFHQSRQFWNAFIRTDHLVAIIWLANALANASERTSERTSDTLANASEGKACTDIHQKLKPVIPHSK